MKSIRRFTLAVLVLIGLSGCGWGVLEGYAPLTVFDNFHAVEPGRAYRSAQLDAETLRCVLDVLSRHDGDRLPPDQYARLAGLAFQGTRTVARLLRNRRALSGDATDGLLGAIGQALDELSTEWGVDL